jgi:hypothetical protein
MSLRASRALWGRPCPESDGDRSQQLVQREHRQRVDLHPPPDRRSGLLTIFDRLAVFERAPGQRGGSRGSRPVEGEHIAVGRPGDCLLAISTSGTSKNILRAARAAKENGLSVIALTGKRNPEFEALADVYVCTPGGRYADRVQELHIKVLHILIELIERHFFPENYEPLG